MNCLIKQEVENVLHEQRMQAVLESTREDYEKGTSMRCMGRRRMRLRRSVLSMPKLELSQHFVDGLAESTSECVKSQIFSYLNSLERLVEWDCPTYLFSSRSASEMSSVTLSSPRSILCTRFTPSKFWFNSRRSFSSARRESAFFIE